jgi:hypothetical protein
MFDNRTSALRREIYKFHASAVPRSSYLDRLLGGVPSRSEGGVVCSRMRSDLMDFREAPLIDRCATRISKRMLRDFEQTAPALAARGHPRLT